MKRGIIVQHKKKTIVVLFGGQSSEHKVSCVSATTIMNYIDADKYCIVPVGITKKGQWLLYNGPLEYILTGEWEKYGTPTILSPDATQKGLIKIMGEKVKIIPIDIVFPVLHGLYGEDGSIQGLLELAQIPYVGCGILSSSVSMDKIYTKIIVDREGIDQAHFVKVLRKELSTMDSVVERIEKNISYPCFIKPSNAGSSVGITKAYDRVSLEKGLLEAAKQDRKILVEETIVGREVECAVLGNDHAKASAVGEIITDADFYDYEAKYHSETSKTIIPADLPKKIVEEIQDKALRVFKSVDGRGLARVDFFVEKDTNRVIFNEINTLPGFTSISMYPMLWEEQGIDKKTLVEQLIQFAMDQE
ncbi:MAG: D-alanine--D-alanine ligase [Epulopiscium sp.]|nr:D-alanine--D-alanine ligase [Candidatus Epulonipiscium sp.]